MAAKIFKTEAVVLRGIRYGEADRILHLYSPTYGRLGAIAKGVRKPRSRFGGRLEPCFRLDLVLHRGRGDLATVSAAETVAGYQALRSSADGIAAGARACDSVLRLLDSVEPNPAAYNLLCRYLELTDTACRTPAPGAASVAASTGAPAAAELVRGRAVAFRLKLALAAGFAPELSACARCGSTEHLEGFSGDAGGVVCAVCAGASFPLRADAHRFMVAASASTMK
ncbi:MAG TPA: DNA repair protein RecO, partial [Solirubrobacterales bacterium]|nr:DNA repair protein RecO [Solirubrobacterales bacterium]